MLKKKTLAAALFCATLSLSSTNAYADIDSDGEAALSNLTSSFVVDGTFTQALNNNVYLGDINLRFPRSRIQFVNFTPPSFAAGCGGISFHFGGFSFIDGEQISKMIENIMAGAVGLVVQMGIQAFCPVCADVLAQMQKLAQMASKMGADSCKLSQQLVSNTLGKLEPFNNTLKQDVGKRTCSTYAAKSGATSDYSKAWEDYCDVSNSFSKALDSISDFIQGLGGSEDQAKAEASESLNMGNKVFGTLISMGYSGKEAAFLLAVLGSSPWQPADLKNSNESSKVQVSVPKTWIKADDFINVLWYGYAGSANCSALLNAASISETERKKIVDIMDDNAKKAENQSIVRCHPYANMTATSSWWEDIDNASPEGRPFMCEYVDVVPLASADPNEVPVPRCGMYLQTVKRLKALVEAAKADQPLPQEGLALIRSVNLPVYKLVKIARKYPTAADSLSMQYAPLITHALVNDLLSRVLSPEGRPLIKGKVINDVAAIRTQVAETAKDLAAASKTKMDVLTTLFDYQSMMMTSINQIEKYMYSEAIGGSIIQSDIYSRMLTSQGLKLGGN